MKALMKMMPGDGHMELRDIPVPDVSGDLVKIRVAYAGICGTDIHAMHGLFANTRPPVVLGHEFSGIVSEIGPDVTRIFPGMRVTAETNFRVCGKCPYCKSGDLNLCVDRAGIGSHVNGAMAEYIVVPESRVHVIPENVGMLAAALTEPLACGVHSVIEKAEVRHGEYVCVFGAGAMGQMIAEVAKTQGAHVIMVGLASDSKRFKLAEKIGIQTVINPLDGSISKILAEMTDGYGPDAAIECTGSVAALCSCMEAVRKKGRVVQLSVFRNNENTIPTDLILNKEIRYMGSRSQKPSSWVTAIELLKEGKVHPERIVTDKGPLEEWERLFMSTASRNGCKAVICCSENLAE